ncbi:MAG: hypothetical protein IKE94_13820 [Aeriscardovia sp.]|nr:hypothetical protein [Aeriscardovia sp.]
MKFIKSLQNRVTKFVQKRGSILPKLFVWLYASIFIGCGLVAIIGIIYEFSTKGQVNYTAVNSFVREYFAPSIAGTFAILGVLLIDKDHDGIPDEWEKEDKK